MTDPKIGCRLTQAGHPTASLKRLLQIRIKIVLSFSQFHTHLIDTFTYLLYRSNPRHVNVHLNGYSFRGNSVNGNSGSQLGSGKLQAYKDKEQAVELHKPLGKTEDRLILPLSDEAKRATIRHHKVPVVTKIIPRRMNARDFSLLDTEMNWAERQEKNTATFGLRILVNVPCR